MADILEFRTNSLRGAPRPALDAHLVSAEIVIFPGVRYERWCEPEATAERPARRSRRRDRLELDD